jgi:sugar phosphate isomerase/epimerase
VTERRFGVSTHLFHDQRLTREHLVHIAAHGFEAIELVARRSHFDVDDPGAAVQLAEWLEDTRLQLHSVHVAPDTGGGDPLEGALRIAAHAPYRFLVLHPNPQPEAARRGIAEAATRAAARQIKVAVEVMPSGQWNAFALTRLIEQTLEETDVDVGVCLDFGHAHLTGDLSEAIEVLSGHIWTTHLHDNGGRRDDHLVPFMGTIDWAAAMMEMQKIGYEDVLTLEVADSGDPVEILRRAAKARRRLEESFGSFESFGPFGAP